jgi:hypothetical protein
VKLTAESDLELDKFRVRALGLRARARGSNPSVARPSELPTTKNVRRRRNTSTMDCCKGAGDGEGDETR